MFCFNVYSIAESISTSTRQPMPVKFPSKPLQPFGDKREVGLRFIYFSEFELLRFRH